MKTPNFLVIVVIPVLLLVVVLPARTAGAGEPPASAPAASQPAPPRKVTIPPGFKLLTINGRKILVEPTDEAWVATAMGKVQPTTKPATLPANLLQKLTTQREALLRQVAIDLALKDLTAAARTYDLDLVAPVRTLDNYRPPIYYLIAAPDRIAEIIRNGWSDPHFYYNRAADSVSFNPAGALTADRPQDEVVFPAAYDLKETPEKKAEALTIMIGSTEASIRASIEIRARTLVGSQFAAIIQSQGVEPLGLKEDQQWFGLGVASILSAKYASVITGDARAELVKMLTAEHPANPIPTSAVDLLHPVNVSDMRQDMLPAYFDAVRRKSGRAVQAIADKAGDAGIAKAIVAVREKKPADGAALVKVVQEATGVELTALLSKG
ncbi:MAG: hypothetical protein QOF78_1060 [Phycisphaerales bacterium]|nr:hypothetical protein [Phycisphaerales bacterium]